MSSGKRESVMLFCTSPIDKLYLTPIEYYEPDVVHIFISDRNDTASSVERKVYAAAKESISCKDIVEHRINTSDFEDVLGLIIEISRDLQDRYGESVDIFINISSGTPEFSAAGMFVSMIIQSAIAFRVDAECSMVSDEFSEIMKSINGSVRISEPDRVTGLKNDSPEDEMVAFLVVVNNLLKKTKYPKFRDIINGLKAADEWSYDPDKKSNYGRTTLEEKEERYLKRHYIAIALENGWLERPTSNTMRLTDSGRAYISVYGPEGPIRLKRSSMVLGNCTPPSIKARSFENEYHCEEDLHEYCRDLEPMLSYEPPEYNTVTFGRKGKKYTFTIEMDQHR